MIDMSVAVEAPSLRQQVVLENPARGGASRDRRSAPRWVRRLLGPVIIFAAWYLVTTATGLVGERSLAPPGQVWDAFTEVWGNGQLRTHLWASLQRVLWGLAIGVSFGVVLAIIAGFFRLGEDVVDSSMNVLRTVPTVALIPLLILWIGIGESAKVTLIVLGVVFPVYMNTFAAIRGVDLKLVEAAQSFGCTGLGLVRRVILPGALPGFLVGLRWALGSAWLLLIFSEQINAKSGIGFMMNQAQLWNRTDIILLVLVIYGTLGFIADGTVRLLERALLSWRRSFSGT